MTTLKLPRDITEEDIIKLLVVVVVIACSLLSYAALKLEAAEKVIRTQQVEINTLNSAATGEKLKEVTEHERLHTGVSCLR